MFATLKNWFGRLRCYFGTCTAGEEWMVPDEHLPSEVHILTRCVYCNALHRLT